MTCRNSAAALLLAAASGLHAAQPAAGSSAGSFPTRPVRIVVGFSPGSLPDVSARLIAQKLGESWKQQVVVDNRAGAGGIIASQIVAGSNPDGYTLLSVSSGHAAAPAIYAKLPFDTVRDFAGITLTCTSPSLLVAAPSLGVKSVRDLVALAKARPGQLNFASAGIGSGTHFSMELFKSMAGVEFVHVPYKGVPEALTETMTGRVQFFIPALITALPLVKDGRVLALGITSSQRSPLLPDVPTVAEAGVPGYQWESWYGLLVPAKTASSIIARLNGEVTRIVSDPDVRKRWLPLGVEPRSSTPAQFDKTIVDEIATFTRLVRAANIKAE